MAKRKNTKNNRKETTTTGVRKKTTKSKKQSSNEDQRPSKTQRRSITDDDQQPNKAQGHEPPQKSIRVTQTAEQKPLTTSVIEHIQCCIETAMLSVLSRKIPGRQVIQELLTSLKQRLLRQCKKMKAPSTKLGNLKHLRRDLADEQNRMEANEAALKSLEDELKKAVETTQRIEEEIVPLQEKLDHLRPELEEEQQLEDGSLNSDALQIPKTSFETVTTQENVQLLKNPNLLLKELCLIESTPAAKDLRRLIEKSYAETDKL
ncbi:centromere protein Q [Bombina bombina]|uniref:centromere protein Q n=1 Tax=Bombina bombina TaxID=8345 RepID=UPI00235AC8EC|nr:centromere protein Q [Bombina bombina]XP_053549767.1 centromere protein Q [Bombina bombina]XP_053549775.1 centromere protein Q [Bombina bombina]